jgi:hypothetical protein
MDCCICLDKIKCLDLIRVLDCGHQYHNICYLRSESDRCSHCRHLTIDSVVYCTANEDFNFFDVGSEMFNTQVECIKSKRKLIAIKEKDDMITYCMENIGKLEIASKKLFAEHLNNFKFKILKATKNGDTRLCLFSGGADDIYEGYSILQLINGGDTKYNKNQGITSLASLISDYFNIAYVHVGTNNIYGTVYVNVYL